MSNVEDQDKAYDQDPDASDNQQFVDQPGDQSYPSDTATLGGEMQHVLHQGAENAAAPNKAVWGLPSPDQALRRGANSAASAILSYLHGDGAADPAMVQQLEASVDPQGQMEESERHLRALQAAHTQGGPEAGFAVLQANRQSYNGKLAFAKSALSGVQGKPPDITAAAQAATQAFTHMPDGQSATFQPSQQGVTATVNGKQFNLSPQQFGQLVDISKDGMFDKVYENGGIERTLQNLTQPQQGDNTQPQTQAPPQAQAAPAGDDDDEAPTGASSKDPYYNQRGFDSDLVTTSRQIFPYASMEPRRMEWLSKMQETRSSAAAERGSKEKVAQTHGDAIREGAGLRAGATIKSSENRAGAVVDKAKLDAQSKQVANATQIASRLQNTAMRATVSAINSWRNDPTHFGQELPPDMQDTLNKIVAAGGGAAAPATSQAPAQQQPQQTKQPRSADIPLGTKKTMNGKNYVKVQGGWRAAP